MKTIGVVVLLAIFSVGLFGVIEQHQRNQAADRERAERTLDECWRNATDNGGIGADVCNQLAGSLNR
jgi:hypothetical protein